MKRICVVCEGQTEETFVRDVLAPAFGHLNLYLFPEMVETSPGHKGGGLVYDRVKRHLRNTLRQSSKPVVTTLFDLYRLDKGFPDFERSQKQSSLLERLNILKGGLHADVIAEVGCQPNRFIPYIQPYEFEALLFSDVPTLTSLYSRWTHVTEKLQTVRTAALSPEHINDGPETKPAAHLERGLTDPKYRKSLHGPLAAQKIGLAKIEAQCAFFAAWLAEIRSLA